MNKRKPPKTASSKSRSIKKVDRGNKTKPTADSVAGFIASVQNERRRQDAEIALKLFKKVTGLKPRLWGSSIVGFGEYHYKYESGREGDFMLTGFSPRATAMVFYLMGGVPEGDPLFSKLGKYKLGKSCLYVNKLDDIDLTVLERMIRKSVAYMEKTYQTKP